MRVRDELGELFPDTAFAEAFAEQGRPGWSPGQLALVTVLQFVENLTDRAAAHRVRYGMDFKYALGLELDDPGVRRLGPVGVPRPSGGAQPGGEGTRTPAVLAEGPGPGEGRWQAAHRLHPGLGRGPGPEPAGAGRGDAAGRAGGSGLCRPKLAGRCGAGSGVGRTVRAANRLVAPARLEDQARGDGPGLRPGRIRTPGGGPLAGRAGVAARSAGVTGSAHGVDAELPPHRHRSRDGGEAAG
ncbi:transposase [Streptomyces sp. R-74717]